MGRKQQQRGRLWNRVVVRPAVKRSVATMLLWKVIAGNQKASNPFKALNPLSELHHLVMWMKQARETTQMRMTVLRKIYNNDPIARSRSLIVAFAVLLPVFLTAQKNMDVLVAAEMAPAITELREFVSIPNDAVNPADIKRNLEWAAKAFVKRGFKTSLVANGELPLFIADRNFSPALKTVLFYYHIDGQPVRANEWRQK